MKILKDFPLSDILWYKIGGKAKVLIEASNKEDMLKAIDYIEKNNIKRFLVVGLGSNLLMSDDYFDGIVIRIVKAQKQQISFIKEEKIESYAGETLNDVISFGFKHNLAGLEWAGGLPGTVGAALRGNVGAFGGEIKNVVDSAEILNVLNDGFNIVKIEKPDLEFAYRESVIKKNKNLIVLSVLFRLSRVGLESLEKAKRTYFSNIKYREKNHPLDYANCGSVFKNITKKEHIEKILQAFPEIKEPMEKKWHGKISVAYVIGKLGFSGFAQGSAKVSEKHNNFIVNLGGAKFSDVKGIIDAIQSKFIETFGFSLDVEVEIVS